MPSALSTTLHEGFEPLGRLRDQWEQLFRARRHEPSVSFEWTAAMARNHVRQGDRCFVLSLARGAECVGMVPLVLRPVTVLGITIGILAPLSEEYNTHSELLLRDDTPETLTAFLAGIREVRPRFDLFRLARLLENAPLARLLPEAAARNGFTVQERDGLPAYMLDLPASYTEYLAARSSKFRNYLKRIERKIDSADAVVHAATTAATLPAALAAMLEIERTSWKHEHGSAISAVQRQIGFYTRLCEETVATGRLHLQWLTLGGVPAAYNLGFVHDGRYHYLKTSYHAGFRQLSPSTYLRARLIEQLIAGGVTYFDFPGEPYEWERQWTDTYQWRRTITLYARTPKALVLYGATSLRRRGRPREMTHVDPRARGGRQ